MHRGRALCAFKRLLTVRVQKLKSEGKSRAAEHGQKNVQSDVLTLLAPITESEESLLSSVRTDRVFTLSYICHGLGFSLFIYFYIIFNYRNMTKSMSLFLLYI